MAFFYIFIRIFNSIPALVEVLGDSRAATDAMAKHS